MVEKIWVCLKCQYVPQNIPYDEQPRTCPKCGSPCKERDVVHQEDFKAIIEDMKRESERLGIKIKRVGSTCERCGGIQPEAGEVKHYPEEDLLLCQKCGDKLIEEKNQECSVCKKPVGVQNLSEYRGKLMCNPCVKIQSAKDKTREERRKTFLENKMVWIGLAALIFAIIFGVLNLN